MFSTLYIDMVIKQEVWDLFVLPKMWCFYFSAFVRVMPVLTYMYICTADIKLKWYVSIKAHTDVKESCDCFKEPLYTFDMLCLLSFHLRPAQCIHQQILFLGGGLISDFLTVWRGQFEGVEFIWADISLCVLCLRKCTCIWYTCSVFHCAFFNQSLCTLSCLLGTLWWASMYSF